MTSMIQRRTLLSAFPFAFLAACARAQGSQQAPAKAADMAGMGGQSLADLTGGAGKVVWLNFAGTVRLTLANTNVRPATLNRAVMMNGDMTSARLFDVWQIAGSQGVAGASISGPSGKSETGPNDAGVDSIWLSRSFSHPAMQAPVEHSRLSRVGARVVAIDATQIWLMDGGVAATVPVLSADVQGAFEAWRLG